MANSRFIWQPGELEKLDIDTKSLVLKFSPDEARDDHGRWTSGGGGGGSQDKLTTKYFSKGPKVEIDPDDLQHVNTWTKEHLGRTLTPAELGKLSGCPDGGTVRVSHDKVVYGGVELDAYSTKYESTSVRLLAAHNGKTILENQSLYLEDDAPAGLGTRIFATQVKASRSLGVNAIEMNASRSGATNGYYTWPRLGADAEFGKSERAKLPPKLASATKVSDLMRTEAGRTWWKANGWSKDMVFDTSPGSLSSKILSSYLAKKGVKIEL